MRTAGEGGVDVIVVVVGAGATFVFGGGAEELAWVDEGGERHGLEGLKEQVPYQWMEE